MLDHNDPRLTAYALGELEASDCRTIEVALAKSPELRLVVEEIRRAARLVDDALQSEPAPELAARQPALKATVAPAQPAQPLARRDWRLPATIAATLLLVATGVGLWATGNLGAGRLARQERVLASGKYGSSSDPMSDESLEVQREGLFADLANSERTRPSAAEEGELRELSEYAPSSGYAAGSGPSLHNETDRSSRLRSELDLEFKPPVGSLPQIGGFDAPPGDLSGPVARPAKEPAGQPTSWEGRPSGNSIDLPVADPYGNRQPARADFDELGSLLPANPSPTDETRMKDGQAPSDPFGGDGGQGQASASSAPGRQVRGNGQPENGSDAGERESVQRRLQELGRTADKLHSTFEVLPPDKSELDRRSGESASGKAAEPESKSQPRKAEESWRRDPSQPNTSRLMVGDDDSLPLEGMQVNVVVDGFRARVLLDCYYHNDRGRQLEGAFQLRLPNEASLYYFAFGETSFQYQPMVDQLASRGFLSPELMRASGTGPDGIRAARSETWTHVKEARLVPREQAAHAYSEVVRRRVDPALVEWSGAGVFQAKVYPLQPGKLHRIVVGYDVNLRQDGEDLVYSVPLPDISQCTVDLDVAAIAGASAEVTPEVRPFVSGGRAFYHFDKPAGGAVSVRLQSPGNMSLVGQDSEAGDFFATRFTPELPAGEQQATSSHAIFLLDTSLSARPDTFNVWLNLLEATLRENRDSLRQFAVLMFHIESHWWRPAYVENTPENVAQLMQFCQTLALEGATDLRQALAEATSPAWSEQKDKEVPTPDLFLLSDGAATWGEINPQVLLRSLRSGSGGTLFAYQTGLTGTEVGVLELLARETGGAVFSVVGEDEVIRAAKAHRQRPWQLIQATVSGSSDLLIAGRPRSIYPGQSLLLVGRGVPQGDVQLQLKRGEQRHEARVPLHRTVASQLTPRIYGQVAVGQLEDLMDATQKISEAYARHFRVTGRTCSLLMLESEADYQRYNIRPQDDLFVVNSTPADPLIVRKLDELAGQLADPKVQLLQWLSRLERAPGLQFTLPPAMQLAIEQMPASAFDVRVPRLECVRRDRGSLPKSYLQWLTERELDYDAISAEADRRSEQVGPADALRAVSNLVERSPGDEVIVQDVAFSAIRWGLPGQAYPLLRRVADRRPYQPHIYTAMGQCLAETGNADLAMVYYEIALNGQWHERYRDIRQIATVEYSHLLRRIAGGELSTAAPDYARARLESLNATAEAKPADLVVLMMWNTDRTDVDLHVEEPSGEECFYKNPNTRAGGKISGDVTEGFGPEMYSIRSAPNGRYTVKANYYNTDANRTGLRTKVYVTVYERFGSKQEVVSRHVVTLAGDKEKRDIVSVTLEK